MRRSWWMVTLAVAVALLGLVALNACGLSEDSPPTSQDQEQFVKSFLADRAFLFDGYATTVTSVRMPVDDTYRLTVRVCGERAGCTAHVTGDGFGRHLSVGECIGLADASPDRLRRRPVPDAGSVRNSFGDDGAISRAFAAPW